MKSDVSNSIVQPDLFEAPHGATIDDEQVVLVALGEFQTRGKELIDRTLPIDRLRGAMRRAAEVLNTAELSDERFAAALERLGAHIKRVPIFVAKHPFRVTVGGELAARAAETFERLTASAD